MDERVRYIYISHFRDGDIGFIWKPTVTIHVSPSILLEDLLGGKSWIEVLFE